MVRPPAAKVIKGADWISSHLPKLDIPPKLKKTTHKGTGIDCPKTYWEFNIDRLERLFEHKVVKDALNKTYPDIDVERSHLLATEGDVERAANLYLIRGVNFIFNAILDNLPLAPLARPKLRCSSQIANDDSRIDVIWKLFLPNAPNPVTVLIVEYKRCMAIKKSEWVVRTYDMADDITQDVLDLHIGDRKKEKLDEQALKIRKEDNQTFIARQLTKYSEEFEAPIILAFDWRNLIMLDLYPDMKSFKDLQNPAQIFISREGSRKYPGSEWTHRRTLLAGYIRALEKLNYLVPVPAPCQPPSDPNAGRVKHPRKVKQTPK
ncbi:hypothetical protein R3P38DRAFT_2803535 [Favolaschia claudopus]|uniref:Uncharacterized protein n=1 Tax=Favolaschia claudopus TaxID=2862362 RepID=A0AAV9ZTM0_9AGAR